MKTGRIKFRFTVALAAVIAGAYQYFSGYQCSWFMFWVIAILAFVSFGLDVIAVFMWERLTDKWHDIPTEALDDETKRLVEELGKKLDEKFSERDDDDKTLD